MNQPPLKLLHSESSLLEFQLDYFRKVSTEDLLESLKPEMEGALKTKTDGTILDGRYRIKILFERDFDIDKLPREIWERVK